MPRFGAFFVCGDTVQTSQARFHGAELSIHPGFISDAVAVLISPGYLCFRGPIVGIDAGMKDPALSGVHFLNHEFDFEFMVKNRSEVIKLADIRVGAAFQQCLQIKRCPAGQLGKLVYLQLMFGHQLLQLTGNFVDDGEDFKTKTEL